MTPAATATEDQTAVVSTPIDGDLTAEPTDDIVADLVIEEISIDGMCGVY